MKKISLLFALFAIASAISAQTPHRVPAYHGVITRIQPSGDTLHVFLRGDERSHFMMTTDGWLVRENKKGVICYAYEKKDGSVKTTSRIAHDAAKRSNCENRFLQRKGQKKNTI